MSKGRTPAQPQANGRQHLSARRFRQSSPLFRWCTERGLLDGPGNALVVGAGLLVEAVELAETGWRVDALETAQTLAHRSDVYASFEMRAGCRVLTGLNAARTRYRIVVVTHVLEFIENPKERGQLMQAVASSLTANGRLLLSLRGWSDVNAAKRQEPRGDGIVTGLGTWTRGYSVAEAQELLQSAGLSTACMPNPKSKTPEQVRLVCQKS